MKLYTFPGAPNPRRVHMYLAEKGLEIPFERVDIMTRANRAPEFIERIDAMGRLPVLELDDGSHLAESVAICRYFEALYPEPPLFGRTPEQQGGVEMWIRRMELDLMVPVGLVWVHGSPLTRKVVVNQVPAVAEQSRKRVEHYFGFMDAQLSERPFLAGEAFSMADIVGFCTFEFAFHMNALKPTPDRTHLARWRDEVSSRPSAIETSARSDG